MNTLSDLWKKLAKKKYREAFVSSQLKRGIPFQIRGLRNQRGWSQADLAKTSDLTQGVISRAEDPDYGNLTFNTILRIAAGFDVAFIGKFIPFSELGGWFMNLSEESVQVASFIDESIETPKESTVGAASAARQVARPEERFLYGEILKVVQVPEQPRPEELPVESVRPEPGPLARLMSQPHSFHPSSRISGRPSSAIAAP